MRLERAHPVQRPVFELRALCEVGNHEKEVIEFPVFTQFEMYDEEIKIIFEKSEGIRNVRRGAPSISEFWS